MGTIGRKEEKEGGKEGRKLDPSLNGGAIGPSVGPEIKQKLGKNWHFLGTFLPGVRGRMCPCIQTLKNHSWA